MSLSLGRPRGRSVDSSPTRFVTRQPQVSQPDKGSRPILFDPFCYCEVGSGWEIVRFDLGSLWGCPGVLSRL